MEAHHFCLQVNEDFAPCVVFDGAGRDARLNAIDWIVSERLCETLPPEERASWHPHDDEILSGQLVAPGMAAARDRRMDLDGARIRAGSTGADGGVIGTRR
jgi:hypothetical protein